MHAAESRVRDYSLYGEIEHLPDILHCEAIAERSALHDWELAPHRHDRLHQLLLVRVGEGVARLGDDEAPLGPGCLVNVPVGEVHAFRFRPGTDGVVLTLADALLDELLARDAAVRRRLARPGVAAASATVGPLMAQLAAEYRSSAPGRALILRGLAAALLGEAARACGPEDPGQEDAAAWQLLGRFDALLDAHFRDHWRVSDYARALAITPTHLSRIARRATGRPASEHIDARVVREARRQLAFTGLSVSSVAYTLGFADPAHFSRVFSRVAGLSPSAFRQRLAAR